MSAATALNRPPLAWTGERMIPCQSDVATEMFHWQRYLYFRPWYEGRAVVDAASGEGYGIAYAGVFAKSATGIDASGEAISHARSTYQTADFKVGDVSTYDYSEAELVLSFETIEHLEDPRAFLSSLKTCKGTIVISTPNRKTHSPGNRLEDKPLNPFHTVEWTPSEFADLVLAHFPTREVRFLSQEARWPGLIREGIDDNAMYCIAVIGGDELPKWPRIGISIPTMSAGRARDAVLSISRYYPGEIEFAILANGCTQNELNGLRDLAQELPHMVHLIEESENLGYGRGANRGLEYLAQEAWFDYFAVSNDDVYPSVDFLPQLVAAANELSELGHRPGLIGGVSNEVNGAQKVDIGPYSTIAEMQTRSRLWNEENHSCANQTRQIRGLFALIHPDCLNEVGGFDPRFGKGNFEDDDYNLRCHQAGFTLWQVQGAFLHHTGSATFRELAVDYESGVQRNLNLILQKWGVQEFADLWELPAESKQVYIPLTAKPEFSGIEARINGEAVDLVDQASDLEFAAWIVREISQSGRNGRLKVLQALKAA